MKYFYLISLISLFVFLLLFKKDDKKHNFIISFIFNLVFLYCVNIFNVSILSFAGIKSSFLLLSIINFLIIFIIWYKKFKLKVFKLQKFKINGFEIFSTLLIICLCILIGFIRFNGFSSINYETTDPAVHYKAAKYYSENMSLLNSDNSSDVMYDSFDRNMPGFSLNCGIFMNVFSFVPSYITYIIFDVIVLCLLALMFYCTCLILLNNKNCFFALILTILYFSAYCLNNFVFGFGYLGIGILSLNLILFVWILLENKDYEKYFKVCYGLLFLFNFILFFSYYLFVPIVYLAQGLYIIYKWYRKEYKFLQLIKIGIFCLVIPFIIGILYFILPNFITSGSGNASSAIATEGYIYRDLWSNFILIAPLIIYSLIMEIKNKSKSLLFFVFVLEFIYILITFVLGLKGYVSSYYYFKSYYIFWLICYLLIVKLLVIENSDLKKFLKLNILYIVLILLIGLSNIEIKIQEKNILFNNSYVSLSYSNIYIFNATKILNTAPVMDKDELKIINEIVQKKDKCTSQVEIPVIGNYLQKLWFYSISDIVPIYNHVSNNLSMFYDENFDFDKWKEDDSSKCLIVFNSYNKKDKENYININFDEFDILYKNKSGLILKKKS